MGRDPGFRFSARVPEGDQSAYSVKLELPVLRAHASEPKAVRWLLTEATGWLGTAFNARTADQQGLIIPAVISIFSAVSQPSKTFRK